MATQIQLRRDTEGDWNDANPVLAEGEVGLILDADEKIVGAKVGNGASTWLALEMHLPLLSGVANALEDAGGATPSGTPVNNDADNHTFLLKGLSAQNSKVLGVADSAGNVKFSVDKDGKTTLNGGVSGDLDLLTGALQIAGNTSMQIMQIVSATQVDGSHSINHATEPKVVVGVYVTITPKSTSSKIILAGQLRCESVDAAAGNSTGHETAISIGNTAATAAVHNGVDVDGTNSRILSAGAGWTSAYIYNSQNVFHVHSPSTTSEVRYDWVLKNVYAANQTLVYKDSSWSSLYAIEIL